VTGTVTSLLGGVAGYGTGPLMPLVLVPILGPEPVVPIIAVAGMLTNASRALAFRAAIDWRRVLIVACAATPTAILGAFAYTLLSGPGAMLLIGSMLVAVVLARRLLGQHRLRCSDRGLAVGAFGWGLLVGGSGPAARSRIGWPGNSALPKFGRSADGKRSRKKPLSIPISPSRCGPRMSIGWA
jgi:uncharacterized membrane protein YfcA